VRQVEVEVRLARRIGQARTPFFIGPEDPVLWVTRKIPGKDTTEERMCGPILKPSLLAKTDMKLGFIRREKR